ncbi:MAG TPA: SUMF1/EgtB/PvdO family nonheme iron enzyme [Candidatus Rubrimentiphilum sp.]|nr:SUMF1/EgtB/PvdO family nonheme iron enzyme [Candidatus Rubrimentiphilum sp.]
MLNVAQKLDRAYLADWYQRNRKRSSKIFALVDPTVFYDRPIPLRHPFAFYEGHLPAFSFLTLNERSLGEPPVDAVLENLFERGIDPASLTDAQRHSRSQWPERKAIEAFADTCDRRVLQALASAAIVDSGNPRLVNGQAAYTVLEHEPMHHETLMYIVHQLEPAKKRAIAQTHRDSAPPINDFIEIASGAVTLGARRDEIAFGWDNEFERHSVSVVSFRLQRYPITNNEYLEFVRAGGPLPPFWIERGGEYKLRGVFEELPFFGSWPVYVSHVQAEAYAQWKNARLMTEAQYHRAAFGTPDHNERAFPWGNEHPGPAHGNFGVQRYDPEPVDAHPAGASAWGVHDLIGNGWEWTGTPFAPFPGFEPMASYPQYSADFFDGKHYVMKGASPVTAYELIRRSFRNWFFADYPYMYAKFRLVLDT